MGVLVLVGGCATTPPVETERVEALPKLYSVSEGNNAVRVANLPVHAEIRCNRERLFGSRIKRWACELVAKRNADQRTLDRALRAYRQSVGVPPELYPADERTLR